MIGNDIVMPFVMEIMITTMNRAIEDDSKYSKYAQNLDWGFTVIKPQERFVISYRTPDGKKAEMVFDEYRRYEYIINKILYMIDVNKVNIDEYIYLSSRLLIEKYPTFVSDICDKDYRCFELDDIIFNIEKMYIEETLEKKGQTEYRDKIDGYDHKQRANDVDKKNIPEANLKNKDNDTNIDYYSNNDMVEKKEKESRMFCRKCGCKIPSDSIFCPKCGFKLSLTKVCDKCGAELVEDAVFCNKCGGKL